jgi:inhibitor of KinA
MHLEPLGDQAILARFETEEAAAQWAHAVRAAAPAWVVDIVPAYFTVAVFFDAAQIRFREAEAWLATVPIGVRNVNVGRSFIIPCCYEMGPDLERVALLKQISVDRVIELHTSVEYTVYAIGFCPGFPYLGYLPEELAGVPRLDAPRLQVEPGSVGITGRQTGVYPLPRPGGWHLIGRTPLALVDLKDEFFALAAGDRVRFDAISRDEYRQRADERLVTR